METKLLWLEGYSVDRLLALVLMSALTAHTLVDLGRQVQRSREFRISLWLIGGPMALTLGITCAVELAAGRLGSSHRMALPDHLVQATCTFGLCLWTLILFSRRHTGTIWLMTSSLALAIASIKLSDVFGLARLQWNVGADELPAVTFLVALSAAYVFLKVGTLAAKEQRAWRVRSLAFSLTMGVLLSATLLFVFQSASGTISTGTQDDLAAGLTLPALCLGTFAVLSMVLTATGMSRQNLQRSEELQQTLDTQRMRDTLADQRVVRLQNEALLQEIQERKKAEDTLRHAAFHDAATGLDNRTAVTAILEDLLKQRRTQRQRSMSATILLRLDDVSTVSSLIGRSTTDQVVKEVARRLQRFAGVDQTLARVGDAEFLLVVKQLSAQEHAMRKANLMLSSIEESIALDGTVVNLSASVGVCELGNAHYCADDVLRDVDLAVEVARRDGGKQCKLFDTAMREEAMDLQQRKRELKAALEREEFVLFYQPLVDMRDRTIYGMEALIRWSHPARGIVAPGAFIPLAEETGQILGIGEWTLRTACHQFAALQAQSSRELLLSVNVSPRQLFETPFLKVLQAVLDETGMPASQLQLEVTESIFLKDASSVGLMMQEIRSLGVKVAFDDFGTGYSSLSYLTRYPIDTLKIDQSFVRGMTQGTGAENLVSFMLGLATEFKMSVTAEGVEEVAHETALLKQGCTFAQGYFYSRPVPSDGMLQMLQNGLSQQKQCKPSAAAGPVRTAPASSFHASNMH